MTWEYGRELDRRCGAGTSDYLKSIAGKSEPFTENELNLLADAARRGWRVYEAVYSEIRPSHSLQKQPRAA